MNKIAIIYWSQTGNTEQMANAIAEGIRSAGEECDLKHVSEITAADAAQYVKLALGCPAMGAEVLEEAEFEPFFTELEGRLTGHKAALFGSYGWGDGQWMRDWYKRADDSGANVFGDEGFMLHETPDESGLEACRDFGKRFAAY
ncbi:flavodoxin [Butyricicoccus sp. Marseille-Q5471]|uniref:flavodoxin n=1 Tax=Butyricicoccus sp. Marseille-Q5471 TaxID=3039493 RepID=UPI0024BD26CB|nr:flavodoxin [Butyricicoccus sp. Marseille-Q5471]